MYVQETVVAAGEGLSDGKWHTLTAIYNKTSIGLLVYGDVGESIKKFSNFRNSVDFYFKTVSMPDITPELCAAVCF